MKHGMPRRDFLNRFLFFVALGFILSTAKPCDGATAPTRAEILQGALTPERTCYHVASYHLDVRVDPATKSLEGSNKITFKTLNDFTTMQVDLWSNLPISKIVFDDGAAAKFTRELNAVFIELPEKARRDSTHAITVYYSGFPVIARRPPWDGGISWDRDDDGNPWVVVTCSEVGASIWWPNKDHASAKPDNTTISITVPPGLDEISNGRLKARTVLPDGWIRYDWFVSYPIDNYCVTFNIGKYAHFDDEYVSADGEKLSLDYYVLPKNVEQAKAQFKQVKTMLAVYEKYFGKYPFYRDGYKLVESPHTGMEHQSCIAYGNHYLGGYRGRSSSAVGLKFDFIIIHESAHEWWGNSVSMKDIADMWIHESFGAYAESLFVEDQFGHDEAIRYINGKKGNVHNDRPIIAEYGRYQKGPGDMYDKGQLVLNTLRSVLDDDALWVSILRGLQEKFKYRNASADEVFAFINQKAGRDLSYFFDQYFRHANIPTLAVQTVQEGDSVTARYRWEAEVDDFRMPIKVTIAPGKFEFIRPTTDWQTTKLTAMAPEDFRVAEDLFYANVRLRSSYLDPRNRPERIPPPTIASTSKASSPRTNYQFIVNAINDQREPKSSGDRLKKHFDWWPMKGTNQWVQYDFAKPARVSAVEVYWFDDTGIGECRLPKSWQLLFRRDGEWKPVAHPSAYGCEGNRYNRAAFDPVETDGLRLEVELPKRFSSGLLQWRVE